MLRLFEDLGAIHKEGTHLGGRGRGSKIVICMKFFKLSTEGGDGVKF